MTLTPGLLEQKKLFEREFNKNDKIILRTDFEKMAEECKKCGWDDLSATELENEVKLLLGKVLTVTKKSHVGNSRVEVKSCAGPLVQDVHKIFIEKKIK